MFNWDEFRNEKVAVWCDTEEKAREFVKECYKRGIYWKSFTESKTMFNWCKEDTCYNFKINEDRNALTFSNKSYYERNNYKIIKWESENMKFKVGDRIEVTNNRCNEPYFNVGDIGSIVAIYGANADVKFDNPKKGDGIWTVAANYMKKIKTEFTFQEVAARNIPGVYVNCNDKDARVQSIEINEYGDLTINADFTGLKEINLGLGIHNQLKFKLQKPKKQVNIYKIEHQKNGKKYDFISSQSLDCDEFVICDTKCGKSYGRIADVNTRELTEGEYKQYKECWRA